jgi:hypothetical protein
MDGNVARTDDASTRRMPWGPFSTGRRLGLFSTGRGSDSLTFRPCRPEQPLRPNPAMVWAP